MLVNDFRITVERAIQDSDLSLTSWIGERELKSQKMQDKIPFLMGTSQKSYKKAPDGAFTLTYPAEEYVDNHVEPIGFFLEVDRGTESNAVWAEKVMAYELFRKSGLAQRYYGVTNFRILVTVSSQRRLDNLVKTTLKAEGGPFYWFTVQDNVDIFRPWRIFDDLWTVAGWEGNYSLKSLKLTSK